MESPANAGLSFSLEATMRSAGSGPGSIYIKPRSADAEIAGHELLREEPLEPGRIVAHETAREP